MKNLYRLAGVAEDLMRTAYQEMRADPDLAEDCEGRATAYLCRHQFATAMVYCGLTPGEIYTVMGHAEEDESVHKSDFANPDAFCALADKMSRRPLVQFFDHLAACQLDAGGAGEPDEIRADQRAADLYRDGLCGIE